MEDRALLRSNPSATWLPKAEVERCSMSIVHFTSDFGPNAKNLNVANRQNYAQIGYLITARLIPKFQLPLNQDRSASD